MASSHQNIALDWVRAEVDQTLLLARNALELFANDRSEPTQLNFCLSHLHQVVGTLKMVELYGAATVASQMEELCAALRDNSVASFDEALEALMAGILHLQNYLEAANEALADVPSTLVLVFNDLKAAKGEEFVAAGFHPDLAGNAIEPNPVLNARMQDKKVAENLRKLRQRFQSSLANVIRNTNSQEHLNFLSKVIERLEKFSKGSPLGQLWTIAYAFLETLNASEESLGSAQKQLLRELDIQLKAMIEEADDAMTRLVPTSLLENLLYYVATSDASSERITSLRDQFGLQIDDDPEKEILGPDKSTLSTIASVLMEELASFKDKIDLVSRDQSAQVDDLKELIPALRQMASSLQMVGISDAEKVLEEQINVLDSKDFVSV
ncbi:Hpt domain-containing protein, partial [Oleiphilus sp. HI0067]